MPTSREFRQSAEDCLRARERAQRILSEDGPARNGRRVPHDGGRSQSAFYPEPPPPIRHGRGRVCWRNRERSVQKVANRPLTIRETQSHGWRGPQGFVRHMLWCVTTATWPAP